MSFQLANWPVETQGSASEGNVFCSSGVIGGGLYSVHLRISISFDALRRLKIEVRAGQNPCMFESGCEAIRDRSHQR